jgi:hypothetical protein
VNAKKSIFLSFLRVVDIVGSFVGLVFSQRVEEWVSGKVTLTR